MIESDDVLGSVAERLLAHADVGLQAAEQTRLEGALLARMSAAPRRGRVRRWIAGHVALASVMGVVSVAGAATTAVVIQQQGTPSHPTQGEVPRTAGVPRTRDLRYEITMAPQAEVGSVGWCSTLTLRYERTPRPFGGAGCGAAPLAARHVFGGSTTYLGKGNGLIAYSVVDDTVAYALTTDPPIKRLLPVSDPSLPNGWRAIVQLPGETHTGNLRYRDALDRPIKTSVRGGQFADRRLPTGASTADVDAQAPCTVALPSGATPRGARWLTTLAGTPGIAGRALLPCAQVRFKIGEAWAEATVFLDAARPGVSAPMPMPSGAKPVGDVDVQLPAAHYSFEPAGRQRMPVGLPWGAGSTARRVDNAWLAIRAETVELRSRLLDEVELTVQAP